MPSAWEGRACFTQCFHRFDHSYQDEEPRVATAVSTQSYTIDSNWYTDTDTTDHITSELDRLTVKEKYHGKDHVQVANSAGMIITHVGHSKIHTPNHVLNINDILHAPKASKHLLLVHKLAKDNNVFFEFHPKYFFVKTQATNQVLHRGRCEGGLYPMAPIHAAPTFKSAYSTIKPTQDHWHCHLGHSSSSTVRHVIQENNLPLSNVSNKTLVCDACQ